MTATLTIEGKEFGRKSPTSSKTIPYPETLLKNDSSITMRSLLAHVVKSEVASFQQRQQERSVFRVLTADQIDAGSARGKIDPAAHEAQSIDSQQAVEIALQAFEDGLFFAFVEREQKESLDEIVTLQPNSTLTFMRLMPLAGG